MSSLCLKAGKLALCALAFGGWVGNGKDESTQVRIGIGAGTNGAEINAGGSVPHVALWDETGSRIGQYYGNANGHLAPGTANEIVIKHTQNGGKKASPHYLSLTAVEGDAICVSMVTASSNGVNWGWTGDLARVCDGDWYHSSYIVGDGTSTPACNWIDADHSYGLRSVGFSLHMPDFAATPGRIAQLSESLDTNCKSEPRMTFWYDMLPDFVPKFFDPPLQYTDDGADKDPKKVITRKSKLWPSDPVPRTHSRDLKKRNANMNPEHLVVSDLPNQSAKEVCEDSRSLGWDFVSTVEGIYCDISAREWWYLCSDKVAGACFDLEKQEMRGNASAPTGLQGRDFVSGRDLPVKAYKTIDRWTVPGQQAKSL